MSKWDFPVRKSRAQLKSVPLNMEMDEKPPLNEKQKELLAEKERLNAEMDKKIAEAGGGGDGDVEELAYQVLLLTHEISKNLGLYKKRWAIMQVLMEKTDRREFAFGNGCTLRINDQFADPYNQICKRTVTARYEPEAIGNLDVLEKEKK